MCYFMHKDEALQQFTVMMDYRNLSPHTLKMYSFYVSKFLDFFEHKDILTLTVSDAQKYVSSLKDSYSPQSRNLVVCAIRYFFDVVLEKPMSRRQFPNIRYTPTPYSVFDVDQIEQLISTDDVRLRLFILLGFDCGLRAGEVARLRIKDIDSKNMLLNISSSKRGKSRKVPLSNACLNALRKYWIVYRPEDYLFPGYGSTPHLSPSYINQMFHNHLKTFDFYRPEFCFHSLRHSFATHMLENDCDIFLLKKILGHSSFASTACYIQYKTTDLKNSFSLSDKLGVF